MIGNLAHVPPRSPRAARLRHSSPGRDTAPGMGAPGDDRVSGGRVEAIDGAHVRIGGRWLLDFTASNYLGLARHPAVVAAASDAVRAFGVSLAAPRALAEDPFVGPLERALARLVGQDDALVLPSTTHVALDILPALAGPGGVILTDSWAYPITRGGLAVAAHGGARLVSFPHDDVAALATALRHHRRAPAIIIACDGVYPATGRPAALAAFARLARAGGAILYVDDAHGIGLLGAGPAPDQPFGHGGGGTPHHCGVAGAPMIHVGSLSKAFGVPLAFAAGSAVLIARLRDKAGSLQHSSPSAIPLTAAALAALRVHAVEGDVRRERLVTRVRSLRDGLARLGRPSATAGPFPVQSLRFPSGTAALALARRLRGAGIRVAPQLGPPDAPGGSALRFVVTTDHVRDDLARLLSALGDAWSPAKPR